MNKSYETLLLEADTPEVLRIVMNRPQVANALNTQMGLDLVDCLEALAMDPGPVRCLILTGAGDKAFCAGGDLKERNGMSEETWGLQHLIFERMARALVTQPLPLIAAVNGAAYGGGCEMTGACDFVYAAEHARFALTEAKLGIIPGAGGTQTLSRAMGERRALELIMTARPFSAQEAEQWGLVNRVLPAESLLAEAQATAEMIARNAPLSVRQAKQAIRRGAGMALLDGMAFEIEAYNRLVPTEDRREGVAAFNEKRTPRFKGK